MLVVVVVAVAVVGRSCADADCGGSGSDCKISLVLLRTGEHDTAVTQQRGQERS